MSHQNFGENLPLFDFDESNVILEASDTRSNCVATTSQLLQEYLNFLDVLSKNIPDRNLNVPVTNDSSFNKVERTKSYDVLNEPSSEKNEKPKIWSITDILGNSSDKHCKEVSSAPVKQISIKESYNSEQSAHPITESQIVTNQINRKQIVTKNKYSKNYNLDANIQIDQKSPLNMSLPKIIPKIAPTITDAAAWPKIKVDISSGVKRDTWIVEGVECYYEVVACNNQWWYLCGTCRVRYSDEKALYAHQYQVHVSVRDRPNDDGYCPYCGLNCFTNMSLQHHLNKMHPYSCFFCHIEFPSQMGLMQHILFTHPCGL